MSLTWTTTPPTEPGFYWVRWDKSRWNFTDEIVYVRYKRARCRDTSELVAFAFDTDSGEKPLSWFTHFSGPIPQPEEPEGGEA
ncbi:MAG: hypothetical protein EBZ48_13360 [Proteobacteria bacterium]|nr:hypothetical protein [Pseudomonadota bacterium]